MEKEHHLIVELLDANGDLEGYLSRNKEGGNLEPQRDIRKAEMFQFPEYCQYALEEYQLLQSPARYRLRIIRLEVQPTLLG